jgi:hypothetical protein
MSAQMMTLNARSRAADVGRGLLALVGAAALVVAVPVGLLAWVGSPLPAEAPSLSDVTAAIRDTYIPDEFLVKALALVCWLVWAELVASFLVEAVAYARGRKAGHVPLAGGLQRGAARLVAGIALLGVLFATRGAQHRPAHPLAPVAEVQISLVSEVGSPASAPDATHPDAPAADPAPTYDVRRRDTLWDIAERHLGDPFRWRDIFQLNEGVPQADGRCLVDPDVIQPGWRLRLPVDAVGLAARAPDGPAPDAPTPAAPAPAPAAFPESDAPGGSPVVVAGGMVLIDDDGAPAGGTGVVLVPDADVSKAATVDGTDGRKSGNH